MYVKQANSKTKAVWHLMNKEGGNFPSYDKKKLN